jgi:hypothetical protein
MNRLQPLWLLLALGLAAALNHWMKPRADYALSIGERTISTGTLWFETDEHQREEFQLVTMQVVARDVPRLLADPQVVRTLWVRSPEQDGAAPDLELFVDLVGEGPAIAADARDVAPLHARRLPIVAEAVGGDARSRVRFRGADTPVQVSEGELILAEAVALGDASQGWRVQGSVRVSVGEGDHARVLDGGFSARLVW